MNRFQLLRGEEPPSLKVLHEKRVVEVNRSRAQHLANAYEALKQHGMANKLICTHCSNFESRYASFQCLAKRHWKDCQEFVETNNLDESVNMMNYINYVPSAQEIE